MKVLKCISSELSSLTPGKIYTCIDKSDINKDTYFFICDNGHIRHWNKNEYQKFTMIDLVEDRDNKLNEILK